MIRHLTSASLALATLAMLASPALAQSDPDSPPDKPPTSRLIKEADAIADDLGAQRGLAPTGPITKGLYDGAQLRERLLAMIAEEYSDAEISNEARALAAFGALPVDLDYKALMIDLLTEQIAGFYDPEAKELFIMKGLPGALQRPTMAHELFHAIQDQHFDLQSVQGPFDGKENSDFALARSALIEGDATLVMLDFSLYESKTLPSGQTTTMADMAMLANILTGMTMDDLGAMEKMLGQDAETKPESALARAPLFIKESLLFPYLAGLRFVVAARAGKKWTDLDALYRDAPVSTEQILHPERFLVERDDPVFVSFSLGKAAANYTTAYENVLGEYQLYLLLKENLRQRHEKDTAGKASPLGASAGWDGDTLVHLRAKDGSTITAHVSVWDSERDAGEWAEAMREVASRRHTDLKALPTAKVDGADVSRHSHTKGALELIIERRGTAVVYIDGIPSTKMPAGQAFSAPVFQARDSAFDTLVLDDLATAKAAAKKRRADEAASKKDTKSSSE